MRHMWIFLRMADEGRIAKFGNEGYPESGGVRSVLEGRLEPSPRQALLPPDKKVQPMTGAETRAQKTSDNQNGSDSGSAPWSGWLRTAVLEAVRREPLLAAEDAIMLVDILTAVSRATMTPARVLSNPMVGGWLKRAVTANLARPLDDALQDTKALRDLLVVALLRHYQDGFITGADNEIRVCNVISMTSDVGHVAMAHWSRTASAQLRQQAESVDGGLSGFQVCAEAESASGHDEMAEILEQMGELSETESRERLLAMSRDLLTLKSQIQ